MADNENIENAELTPAASEPAATPAKKEKAEKKPEKKSKPGIFKRMGQWFKEMKAELKKVQWPTWKQTLNNTLIVLACCVVVGVFIWLFDLVAENLFGALIDFFHSF